MCARELQLCVYYQRININVHSLFDIKEVEKRISSAELSLSRQFRDRISFHCEYHIAYEKERMLQPLTKRFTRFYYTSCLLQHLSCSELNASLRFHNTYIVETISYISNKLTNILDARVYFVSNNTSKTHVSSFSRWLLLLRRTAKSSRRIWISN